LLLLITEGLIVFCGTDEVGTFGGGKFGGTAADVEGK
jgi:hypothetical protein